MADDSETSPLLSPRSDHDARNSALEATPESDEVGVITESIQKEEEVMKEEKKSKFSKYTKFIPGYGIIKLRRASAYSVYVLSLLLAAYLLNQLNRYTIAITAREVAQDVHFGDKSCLVNESVVDEYKKWLSEKEATDICPPKPGQKKPKDVCLNETFIYDNCSQTFNAVCSNDTIMPCEWNYDGSGLEYQILAGPVFNNVYPAAGLILGPMADFVSRKLLLGICLFLLSVFTGIIGFAQTYWELVILRMLVAICAAGCTPFATSLIADYFVPELRGSALGVYNWGIYLGYSLAFVLGNQIVKVLSWRWVFFISALMGIAVTPLILLTIKEDPQNRKKKKKKKFTKEEQSTISKADDNEPLDAEQTDKSVSQPPKRRADQLLSYLKEIMNTFVLSYSMWLLLLAGGIRNAGGYVWAYNTENYFILWRHFTKDEITKYMSWIPLVGGSVGAFVGGLVSDLVVYVAKKYQFRYFAASHWRIWVLVISQLLAAPFAAGALLIPSSPGCFLILIGSNVIGEMWVGVTLALVVDIVPSRIKTVSIAIYLFVITVIGGNFNLLVTPLKSALHGNYMWALLITFPGVYLLSAFLFLGLFFLIGFDLRARKRREARRNQTGSTVL